MPTIKNIEVEVDTYVDADIDLDVDEFIAACSDSEIQEIIDILIEDNWLNEGASMSNNPMSVSESEFEEALNKLHGNWNRLSQEEEETILKIANRF